MRIDKTINQIFKQGSIVYYYSSLFFPKEVKADVFALYSFVRTADNFVDAIPQQTTEFADFFKMTRQALTGEKVANFVINSYMQVHRRHEIKDAWLIAFMRSMEMDLSINSYQTFADLEEYIYGSADVIGLMMAKIMNLPQQSYHTAQKLGKAMQFLNFIRDIREDLALGRVYLPQADLAEYKINHLTRDTPYVAELIRYEVNRYYHIQKEAEAGYQYLPDKYLYPIKTAADMYLWTARKIESNPLIVFDKKVKPKKWQVVGRYLANRFGK